ncbi:vascular cell adhesion protein 1-like isoform X1 [Heptranchias perlo]|uniref:vascular cell adhesion protein 1-like isoform X1 n=1 Tax=Heptranchias perlo TaxID=212740 RepID=UPI00355AA45A
MASGRSLLYSALTLTVLLTTGSSFNLEPQPKSETWIRSGEQLVLSCRTVDCPSPHFNWRVTTDYTLGGTVSNNDSVSTLTLSPVTIQHTHRYICTATCGVEKKERSFMVNVYSFPDAIMLETVGALEVGKKGTLRCTIPDVYPLHLLEVEWLEGTTPLHKEDFLKFTQTETTVTTNYELTPELGDSGREFTCRARLVLDKIPAETADRQKRLMLQLHYAPRMTNISVAPSHTVREGQDIRLTCTTDSSPAARIVWSKLIAEGWSVTAEGEQTLHLPAAQVRDTGIYRCEASNELGKETSEVEIHIQGAPRDTSLSVTPSTVKEGDHVTVTCTTHANPSAQLVLRKKSESGQMVLVSENGTLTIDAAQSGDAGQYECEAINDLGTDTTRVELTVLEAPRDTSLSVTPSTVKEGDRVTVTCTTHANPSAQLVLRKKSESGQMVLVSENGILTIDAAQSGDAGQYECEAINDLGTDTTRMELTVLGAPKDTSLSVTPSTVKEGDRVTVTCTTHANPSARLVLRKKSESGQMVLDLENGTLTIDAAEVKDAGQYECEAINELGRQIRSTELIVQVLTVWAHPSKWVNEGENVTIGCSVHSSSTTHFIWKKLENNSEAILCSNNNTFTILEITQSDAGFYEVEVINELGNQRGFVEIKVNEIKLDIIPADENPTGIVEIACVGAALGSAGLLLSTLYYIYRRSNCKGSYHMPIEQTV